MKYALAIALVLVMAVVACTAALPEGVVYPSISPDTTAPGVIPVTASFTFEGQPVTISLDVDRALYEGATKSEKTVTRFGNARENDWIEDYFPAFVSEPHQKALYRSLIAEFRRIRDERGLDGDRYAELMTVYVQSLEYRSDPQDLEPKFPVETLVEGNGDCDDKALLLGALLSHEGYDVAVMLFEPEKHVALGIRSNDLDYRNTGYAYIETTTQGFIGMVPEQFAGGLELKSKPRVFALGSGKRSYTSADDVRAILDGRQEAEAEARVLGDEIAQAGASLRPIEAKVRTKRAELDSLHEQGRIEEYNALVGEYNAVVARYNAATQQRSALAERLGRVMDVGRIIVDGLDDRMGTYAAVLAAFG